MRVDDRGIQAVLKEVENEELSLALRTATEDLKEKIFSNMSERAAGLIREEMEFKLRYGADALTRLFEQHEVTEIIDLQRPNVCGSERCC